MVKVNQELGMDALVRVAFIGVATLNLPQDEIEKQLQKAENSIRHGSGSDRA